MTKNIYQTLETHLVFLYNYSHLTANTTYTKGRDLRDENFQNYKYGDFSLTIQNLFSIK